MLPLEAALERVLAGVTPLPAETVPLSAGHRRWLARDIVSALDLPPFDNSAMDGYAVCAAGLARASSAQPVPLRCTGEVAAGGAPRQLVAPGECCRIFTGAPLPPGADAVVMQEDTRTDPAAPATVWVHESVRPWENVRFRGEDMKVGTTVGHGGERLTFAKLAAIGAVGQGMVEVGRKPRIGLLATGNELAEPGTPLAAGQIYETNRVMVHALAGEAGCETMLYPVVRDSVTDTQSALTAAFAECDVVITSGGVSVGAHDHVKTAFERIGGKLDLWRISMRPGKPLAWGRLDQQHFFGLPGNPVSAAVTFLLVVRPALIRLQGGTDVGLTRTRGTLAQAVSNPGARRHFVRVTVSPTGETSPVGTQGSHVLSGLRDAQGLLDVPPGADWETGRTVEILQFP